MEITLTWNEADQISKDVVGAIGETAVGPGLFGLAFTIGRIMSSMNPEEEIEFASGLLDWCATYLAAGKEVH